MPDTIILAGQLEPTVITAQVAWRKELFTVALRLINLKIGCCTLGSTFLCTCHLGRVTASQSPALSECKACQFSLNPGPAGPANGRNFFSPAHVAFSVTAAMDTNVAFAYITVVLWIPNISIAQQKRYSAGLRLRLIRMGHELNVASATFNSTRTMASATRCQDTWNVCKVYLCLKP